MKLYMVYKIPIHLSCFIDELKMSIKMCIHKRQIVHFILNNYELRKYLVINFFFPLLVFGIIEYFKAT